MTAAGRVLHGYSGNLYGGIEAMLRCLARDRSLAPGMDPHFSLCFEGRLLSELREAQVPVELLGSVRLARPWTIIPARLRFRQLLKRLHPDVVVLHAPWNYLLLAPVARFFAIPVVFWQHDAIARPKLVEKICSRTPADLVIANSHYTATTTPKIFPDSPVEVLYCPVPPPPAMPAGTRERIRGELTTPLDSVVILQASRLERWKGQGTLIESLGTLRDNPRWVLWIAGGAQRPREVEYLDELKQKVANLGIADRVRFLGQRNDIPSLLRSADLFCQVNTGAEPFGIALVEALYAGLPVVTSDLGGAAEVVDASCGLKTIPGDVSSVASALRPLIDDEEYRRSLGSSGPKRAHDLCDPREILTRLNMILSRVRRDPGTKP